MSKAGDEELEETHLGFTFHRTFSLVRSAVSQVMESAFSAERHGLKKLSNKTIKDTTSLGTIYVEAMPRYARGAGLLNGGGLLTDFGRYVQQHDKHLDNAATQWLMHYYLSAPQGPGALFWSRAVAEFFYSGTVFTSEDLVDFIGDFVWKNENRVLSKRAVQNTATAFLGTYTKPEGLGKLHILEETDVRRYRVQTPMPPSDWVIGHAFLDFWAAHYAGRISVALDTLHSSGFGQLFLLGRSDMEDALRCLQDVHYVEVHRTAPPFQVVLLRTETSPILVKLYA